jgi:hypothetical protein
MALSPLRINLTAGMFQDREQILLECSGLSASTFRFSSGVCGLRMDNERGSLVMLPYQGQQIWSARFDGRDLTMRSMFAEPRPGVSFLETFGGFLQHCGATAMGGPSPQDTHPLHGELPNAPYQQAYLVAGEDEKGAYIGLGGGYRHTVAFACDYMAEPLVKLYSGSTLFEAGMTITNLKASEMELMFLMHINFRPVNHSRLVYSAPYTPDRVRVRMDIPAHVRPRPGYPEFLRELKDHPEKHHFLEPGLLFDPEVAFFMDYQAGEDGWAHSLQVHPNGTADYVAHRPEQLPRATRWLCRTPDQDSIAIIEPGTAEPEGYLRAKSKGDLKILPPKGQWYCQVIIGALASHEAEMMAAKIDQMMGRG